MADQRVPDLDAYLTRSHEYLDSIEDATRRMRDLLYRRLPFSAAGEADAIQVHARAAESVLREAQRLGAR